MKKNNGNWFFYLESRRSFYLGIFIVFCVAVILVACMRNPAAYDLYWHLRMGMDLVINDLSPYVDHYSFTYLGEPITGPPVAFQVLYFGLYQLFGEAGSEYVVKAGFYLLVMAGTIIWLRQIKAPVIVCMVTLVLIAVAVQLRMLARPELLSYVLMVLAFILYQRTRLQMSLRSMSPIVGLMALWILYHSPLFGYIIFAGLFTDIAARMLREQSGIREWLQWLGWGFALFLTGFINQEGSHWLFSLFGFEDNWKELIKEYYPPTALLQAFVTYLVMAMGAVTILLVILQKRWGYLLIAGVFLYGAISMQRLVGIAVIAFILMFAHTVSCLNLPRVFSSLSPQKTKVIGILTGLYLVTMMFQGMSLALTFLLENRSTSTRFPVEIVNYLEKNGNPGPIFNLYRHGGYLIFRLTPDFPVYIDGRTNILYPLDHMKRWAEAKKDIETFQRENEKYHFEYTLLDSSKKHMDMMAAAGFSLDFADNRFTLFSRMPGNFDTLGKIWAQPECWDAAISKAAMNEFAKAKSLLPPYSNLMPLAEIVNVYAKAEKKAEVIDEYPTKFLFTDASKRFFAQRAYDSARYEVTLSTLGKVTYREPKDRLIELMALRNLGNSDRFEQSLDLAVREANDWPDEKQIELAMLMALIKEQHTSNAPPQSDDAMLESLKNRLALSNVLNTDLATTPSGFCRS